MRVFLNSVLLLLLLNFVSGYRLELIYISLTENTRSSLIQLHVFQLFCFSSCVAAIAHRNHFFCFYQQNKFSASKAKSRLVIVAKGFLKLPNLLILIKQESITS